MERPNEQYFCLEELLCLLYAQSIPRQIEVVSADWLSNFRLQNSFQRSAQHCSNIRHCCEQNPRKNVMPFLTSSSFKANKTRAQTTVENFKLEGRCTAS